MATRQRRPAVVRTQAPRPQVRVHRATLYGPTSTTTTTLDPTTGEVTVTTVPDTLTAQKRNIVKGSLVTMSSSRGSYADMPLALYKIRYPDHVVYAANGSPTLRVRINRTHSSREVWLVEGVSDDKKLIVCRPVVEESYRRYDNVAGHIGNDLRVVKSRFPVPHSDPSFVGPTTNVPTMETLVQSIEKTALNGANQASFHRMSHVTSVIDPTEVDPMVWAALRKHMCTGVRRGLVARLASQVNQQRSSYRRFAQYDECSIYRYRAIEVNDQHKRAQAYGKALRATIATYRVKVRTDVAEHGKVFSTTLTSIGSMCRTAATNASRYGKRETSANTLVQRVLSASPVPLNAVLADCGHLHNADTPATTVVTGISGSTVTNTRTECPACATRAMSVTLRDGTTHLVNRQYVTVFHWSDGTARNYGEPEIIGQRHSGKGVVGFVPSLKGASRTSMVTCGVEIEVQSVDSAKRNAMAQLLKKRLVNANVLTDAELSKYWHMEHDGSTGEGGFEIVTGYTDHTTHALLLGEVFLGDDGGNPWAGKLLGHDARGQTCGIHVHVQKPTSLIHATKIRQFINAASSERLIRAVARRYGNSYCSYSSQAADNATAQAVKVYKDHKRTYNSPRETVRTALMRLNANSRYEAVNFQNSATVEFRMFRSSTKYATIMACIEFSLAVWRFARVTKAESMTTESFLRFIEKPENRGETRHLRNQLKSRGFDVAVPNPKKTEAVAEVETETN